MNEEWLIFRFNENDKEQFAVNIAKVREVIRLPELTQMPGAARDMIGMIAIRGEMIGIYDLAPSFGFKPPRQDEHAYVILHEFEGRHVGIILRKIQEILNVSSEKIESVPDTIAKRKWLKAITEHKHHLIQQLNVEEIFKQRLNQE